MSFTSNNVDFQTLPIIADFMVSMVPKEYTGNILEPTPGAGNIRNAIIRTDRIALSPTADFWKYHDEFMQPPVGRIEWAVMNPPFSPMKEGMRYLKAVMEMSDNIIALLPWFIIINSERRLLEIQKYGLKSVTNLPRKAFPNSRIQCCVLEMSKGYVGPTEFKHYTFE